MYADLTLGCREALKPSDVLHHLENFNTCNKDEGEKKCQRYVLSSMDHWKVLAT